ncbi:MAG: AbrB/MazE/SpoVT family DNA-binding domain-containing protein [Acetobacteraceae bacterium]
MPRSSSAFTVMSVPTGAANGAEAAGLCRGERVDVEAEDGNVVIRRAAPRFTLAELFRGKSAAGWRQAYARAFDWGPALGREVIEE